MGKWGDADGGGDPVIFKPELGLDDLARLEARKGVSVSVCLPALNEAPTIGDICRTCLMAAEAGLVHELLVVDSGSTDGTQDVAAAAGATVYQASELLAAEAPEPLGKGGALWKSLAVATGDVVVWVDSDTRNFELNFVAGLIEPLLRDDNVRMAKAFYDRPLVSGDTTLSTGGARVTELTFRPLAQLLFPELADLVQPLSGEYAAYREDLLDVGFFSGYGVETGLMIDLIRSHGADSVAQVDLGARLHHNQDVLGLGRMAFEVVQVLMTRAEQMGRLKLEGEMASVLRQFESGPGGPVVRDHRLAVRELPPMRDVLAATGGTG